ncbi:MAG: NusG domain II-containing protein [Betaproteobacteria bacterium]|nr:NusG domain II-containing protein [Betaproteobacteria bacterium]
MTERIPDGLRELLTHAAGAGHLPWRALFKPGDWLLLLCAAALVAASFPLLWRGGVADRAIVRRDGQVVTELALNLPRKYEVTGAIGTTVIEVRPGRARVLSDPGPRQYCVQQGWLTRANAVAICAPNHVTLQLAGRGGQNGTYDTLNY